MYAFVANLPPELVAMLKIFYSLYGVQNPTQMCLEKNALLSYKRGDLIPYARDEKKTTFYKYHYKGEDAYQLVAYPSTSVNFFYLLSVTSAHFKSEAY